MPVVYCIIYFKHSRDAEYIYTQVLSKERIPRYTCAIDKATGAGYFAWQQEFSPWQHVSPQTDRIYGRSSPMKYIPHMVLLRRPEYIGRSSSIIYIMEEGADKVELLTFNL